ILWISRYRIEHRLVLYGDILVFLVSQTLWLDINFYFDNTGSLFIAHQSIDVTAWQYLTFKFGVGNFLDITRIIHIVQHHKTDDHGNIDPHHTEFWRCPRYFL